MMKSKCKYEKYISPYIDGELNPEKTSVITEHLASCAFCQRVYEGYVGADNRIREMEAQPVSNAFDRKFWQRVEAADENRRQWVFNWGWRPVLAAAASLVLVIGLLFLPSDTRKPGLSFEEVVIAENLELFRDYELVRRLDLLEHWDEFNEPADA